MDGLELFFQTLDGWAGYTFLYLSSLAENLFPPMPGDTFVILGAFLVGQGKLSFLPAYVATTSGSLTGFMILYTVGARWGVGFFKEKSRFFSLERLSQIEKWFEKYGNWVLAFNRFLSGFRALVSFAAGVVGIRGSIVFLFGLISCLIWNALLMCLGIWVGENWTQIVRYYQQIVFALIFFVILGMWIWKTLKRKRQIHLKRNVRKSQNTLNSRNSSNDE